jgi:20S proteasome alpha/beta subunit
MIRSLASRAPAPRLADRRRWNVTICIAAFADQGKKLVFVSDSKVAFGSFSADKAVQKTLPLGERNVLLMAGNDSARAQTVFDRSKSRFDSERSRDADRIAEIVFEECNAERDRIIEACVLRRRGFNWEMFRKGGRNFCTDAVYYEIESEIADVKLSLDCLIAGFDSNGKPHIRFTNCETPPENYDQLGFYAIGTGAQSAMSSLAHAVEYLGLRKQATLSAVVYHVLAAKFMSESAQDVGQDTFLMVGGPGNAKDPKDKDVLTFSAFAGIDVVREKWETEGGREFQRGSPPRLMNC